MFGIQCAVCGLPISDAKYRKGSMGESLYWANPKISDLTDEVVNFCGPEHATKWYGEKMAARNGENGQSQSQP